MRYPGQLGQTEIEQLHAGLRDEKISRFQVAVYDSLSMCPLQCIGDLRSTGERLAKRQRPLQGLPLYVFHDKVIRSDVIELANVWVVQRGDGSGLSLEALREAR